MGGLCALSSEPCCDEPPSDAPLSRCGLVRAHAVRWPVGLGGGGGGPAARGLLLHEPGVAVGEEALEPVAARLLRPTDGRRSRLGGVRRARVRARPLATQQPGPSVGIALDHRIADALERFGRQQRRRCRMCRRRLRVAVGSARGSPCVRSHRVHRLGHDARQAFSPMAVGRCHLRLHRHRASRAREGVRVDLGAPGG